MKQLLTRNNIKVVITGDSLAYNRYDFDPQHRENAYDCFPGILSWSFMLRDAIYQNDKWYVFGDEIQFEQGRFIRGGGFEPAQLNDTSKYLSINHGRVSTIFAHDKEDVISFIYSHSNKDTNRAILYMQKRPDQFACTFDIYVDGKLALSNVNTDGRKGKFQGWEPFELEIPVQGDEKNHEITFQNITNIQNEENTGKSVIKENRIILAGIGTKRAEVYLTGNGGKTTQYFLENIEERIMQYEPDYLLFIVGANDRVYLKVEEFDINLRAIMDIIKSRIPKCKILLITPPNSEDLEQPKVDKQPYFITNESSKPYIDSMYSVSKEYNCVFFDLIELFKDIPVKKWRYDNVHFTKWGNTYLARNLLDIISPKPEGIFYLKELVDAEI